MPGQTLQVKKQIDMPQQIRRYRLEEMERMTLLQLRDVCEREKIIHPDLYGMDRDQLIRLVTKFRGSRTPLLIKQSRPEGMAAVQQALSRCVIREIPHKISLPARVVAWKGLDTGFFDGFTIPYHKELDGVNAAVTDREGAVCAFLTIESFPGQPDLYLCRSGGLPCRAAEVRDYRLFVFPHALSDEVFSIYIGEKTSLAPEILLYAIPLLDFLVLEPIQATMPLCVDFGTTNTAAGVYIDSMFYDQIRDGVQPGQLHAEQVNYLRYLDGDGRPSPVLPTIVGVERIEGGSPVFNVGYEAERMVLEGSMAEGSCVFYDIKRWVDEFEKEEELYDQHGNRMPMRRAEIIGAFLSHVIASAQQRFKCHFPVVYLSHPVKQKERFAQLYAEVLPEKVVSAEDAIDEAVAVLYGSIHRLIDAGEFENGALFKALVLDCGGGTTDLTSCGFSIRDTGQYYAIDIETAYENGDTDFGGNNLTFRILQLLKIEACRQLAGGNASLSDIGRSLDIDLYRAVDEGGTAPVYESLEKAYEAAEAVIPTRFSDYLYKSREEYYMVRGNYYFLFALAEQVKKAFFSDKGLWKVTVSSVEGGSEPDTCHIYASRWKLAAFGRNGLELKKDFPAVSVTAPLVGQALGPDIYYIINRFLRPVFEEKRFDDYQIISLTGQSCKISLFRDCIKEFIPGAMIRSQRGRQNDDYRLKLSCLDGIIRYVSDRLLGYTRVTIQNNEAALPYELYTYTHTGAKMPLVQRLNRAGNHGTISRTIQSSQLRLHLEDYEGNEKHIFHVRSNPIEFVPVTYEEIESQFGKRVPQAEVDVIENGELRYFVWADTGRWSFAVVPIARQEEGLRLGGIQYFPFESDAWSINFFDGNR